MFEDDIQMLRFGLNEDEKINYEKNKVETNKRVSRIFKAARENAKRDSCYICKKSCSSFCKSHSVPLFCLKRIADDGKVYFSGAQLDVPYLGDDSGIKEAGTFQLICRNCDSRVFQDYENPLIYHQTLTSKTLAQIAMKNYLQMISKRLYEKEVYLLTRYSNGYEYASRQLDIIDLDLPDYISKYNRARIASSGHHDNWYYLCYFQKLNYVVPMASQAVITMVCDFEGNIINDIYYTSSNYRTQDIHLAIFPLEQSSIVLMFIDSRDKKYRKFYQQLNKLSLDEQLATINYIIHSYSENVFLSKKIDDSVLKDANFRDICRKSSTVFSSHSYHSHEDSLTKALAEFNLSKRNNIPNLLSSKYKLNVADKEM